MEKIKQFLAGETGKDIMIVFIVILAGLGSFSLGRLSKSAGQEGLKVEYMGQAASVVSSIDLNTPPTPAEQSDPQVNQSATDKAFFASKKGKKYYSLGCQAGKSIKVANRVYFKTAQEAESAGYTISTSC
jgi:hypothetical protein